MRRTNLPALVLLVAGPLSIPAQQKPPSFKAETNLVLVPVVVRDAKGEAVGSLTKADFKLFDNDKEQAITSFSIEETSGRVAEDHSEPPDTAAPTDAGAAAAGQQKPGRMVIPEHFVALLFDDEHFKPPAMGDWHRVPAISETPAT
jgi:VWFA-related protein